MTCSIDYVVSMICFLFNPVVGEMIPFKCASKIIALVKTSVSIKSVMEKDNNEAR